MYKLLTRVFSTSTKIMSTAVNASRLAGKVAVVTASSDGIGFAIAKRLSTEGASVVISSRKESNVNKAVETLQKEGHQKISGVVCHVAKKEDRQKLFEHAEKKFGGIDILVSNAAVNPATGPVVECPENVWDKIFEVNVKSTFLLTQEVLPYIRKRNGGSIVYVSSIGGLAPFKLLGAYSVSKTALLGLTKAVAQDLASENIRVNCLAPGITKTKFAAALYETEEAHEIAVSNVPMGRLAVPDEMGGIVAFLCSDDASYITGEVIVAAGGMQSRL
ncbi:dehydrogenase/reductase SDR family member 4 isoform X2 [Diaphorina citri]|uniref:Dehydrogenase/reductase SDR family member 4 isoform X1 n=1 Tax=Diaphorina citri TaxID=121845 RepID=A0A1S4ECP8_DIACI|nr:dehydrogenase/reductase SDR family member 4 isoform X1 [Diaphorina citri]XP_026679786.1 dehydrogenase/reductase SDR family member 4 isoform X1 [Diaphorina citri]XP_026679787.1 dehydrogenase/reductase SDR family member 4 isoform X2 [Diaphorina citri]